jgi:hypothetical protein
MRDAWQPHENAEWRRRSRSHLNTHHLVFRSHCGSDDASNLVTLCCYGRAPDAIWWEFGLRPAGPPLVRYFGERIAGAPAPPSEAQSRKGSASCRPLSELWQEGAAPRAPGL